jgi:hypothetical protein
MPDTATAPDPAAIDTSPNRVPKAPSYWKNLIPGVGPMLYATGVGERQKKASELIDAKNGLLSKLPSIKDQYGEDSPEFLDTYKKFQQANYDLGQMYHPDKAPGALQQDWHWLLEKMHGIKQTPSSTTSQTPATTLNTPAAPSTSPELPAYQQTTPRLPSQGGNVTTPVAGAAATTLPGMGSVPKGATPTMVVAKPKGLVEAGNIPIWNRPSVLNDDGTHSSELSISMQDDKGNQVLIPLIVNGKFLTPDGKMPSGPIPHNAQEWEKASPEWKALKMRAWQNYEKTGQHLGKFGGETAEDDVDAYAQVLHNRGSAGNSTTLPAGAPVTVAKAAAPSWGQAQVLKQKAEAMKRAQEESQLMVAAAPLSPTQSGKAQADQLASGRWENLRQDLANWNKDNPDASKEDKDAVYAQLYDKWINASGKGHWETVTGTIPDPSDPNKRIPVSYFHDTVGNRLANPDGTPIDPNAARGFIPDPKATGVAAENLKEYAALPEPKPPYAEWIAQKAAKGRAGNTLTFDKATGQVSDKASGKRYNVGDPNNPPEVAEMFKQQSDLDAKTKAFQLKMASIRGAAYNMTKPMVVLDSANGNAPGVATYGDMLKQPGRFVPASEGDKAIAKENMMQDIAGSSKATRAAINNLKEDFPVDMQTKMVLAMQSEDPPDSLHQLIPASAINALAPDQQNVFIALQQLVEQGMAMRSILGAGQGSDQMRAAMRTTLPSVLGPSKAFANKQLDAFDATLHRLHRGVPNVKLNETPMAGTTPLAGSGKKRVSLKAAMNLPVNKGKTKEEVQKDIESKGYEVMQ